MVFGGRKFSLGIWGFALGYFCFYAPYSALIKVLTTGPSSGGGRSVTGLELLPFAVVATVAMLLTFITAAGWWKYAGRRRVLGLSVPVTSGWVLLSGCGTAIIIGTTTLAYSFSGVTILFSLLMMRGGVLMMGPLVDAAFGRKVRWFSWGALALSLAALGVILAAAGGHRMSAAAATNIAAYLTGYLLRLPSMTKLAKSGQTDHTRRYFVEEQVVSMSVLLVVALVLALAGWGDARHVFTNGFEGNTVGPALLVGVLYGCLFIFGTLIYLDRRENTFCILLNRGSSLLSVVAASYGLTLIFQQPPPSGPQLLATALIALAMLFLSPLHHLNLYLAKLRQALAERGRVAANFGRRLTARTATARAHAAAPLMAIAGHAGPAVLGAQDGDNPATRRRIFLFVCSGNTCRSPMAEAIGRAEIAARLGVPLSSLDESHVQALSAGLSVRAGAGMTPEAQDALRLLGVPPPSHSARALTVEMVREAEVIYCMTEAHRREVVRLFPSAAVKTYCLDPDGDIADPLGSGVETFLNCARQIRRLVCLRFDEAGLEALA